MATVAIILVTLLYRGESNADNSRVKVNIDDQKLSAIFKELQFKVINSPLTDPSYKLNSAMYLIQNGFVDEGISVTSKILTDDPRNLDAFNGLALTSEQLNKIPDAIIYREKMAKLDPWNAVNYLELGKDYKAQGNLVKSKAMLDKILSFASNNPIAEQAKTELAS
jgi:tetratricopeptide (TPR) repeat protein